MTRAPLFFAGAVLLFVGVFSAAVAQDTYAWDDNTRVTIQPTSKPGAWAEVVFLNQEVHTIAVETITLEHEGLSVTITVTPDRAYGQPDTMTVTPPAGFMAVPESLTVPENGAGVVHIYEDAIG